MADMLAILKFFKGHLSNCKIELKLDGRQHRDSELLKFFGSGIQDGGHSGHFENLQTISALER